MSLEMKGLEDLIKRFESAEQDPLSLYVGTDQQISCPKCKEKIEIIITREGLYTCNKCHAKFQLDIVNK